MPAPVPRPLRPEDIRSVVVLDELDAAPDGSAAVVARRVVRGSGVQSRYETHLWLVPLDRHGAARRLTAGPVRDSSPRVSPDGRSVAFIRRDATDDDAPAAVYLLDLRRGGSPRRLLGSTQGMGDAEGLAWSPDGRRLALAAEVDPPRFLVGATPVVGSAASRSASLPAPTARRIRRANWRWDETGHRDRWSHAFVLTLDARGRAAGPPRQVTRGEWGVEQLAWHPDGRTLAFVADPGPDADLAPCPGIWAVDVDAGPRSRRSRPWLALDAPGGAARPAWSPDGRWLAAVGVLAPQPFDDVSPGLLVGPADASAPPHALDPDLDRPFGNWVDTDLNGWMAPSRPGPVWIDATTIAGVVTDRGRALPALWRIAPRDGSLLAGPSAADRTDTGPWADAATHALAVTPGSTRAVALATLDGHAMEVLSVDLAVPAPERVLTVRSRVGSSWQRRFVQPEMIRLEAPGAGGTIETWVASPPGAGESALPTVVDIHGGPLGGWAPAPGFEVTMLVGAGYRVVLPNIRGSAGYGRDWIRPQLGDWGGVDAADIHAALDHVVGLGWADPSRLGVLGLSYGGFLVHWLVGTSDRFAAAVAENGVTNQVSCWANSDSGPEYCRAALMGDTLSADGVARLWDQSPLRHVADVHTPLLMLQAEDDHRCPPADNEQFFVALRHLGREVEYVLYPGSSHVFSVTGRPDRRIDRMARVLAWFDHHLTDASKPSRTARTKRANAPRS